MGQAEAHTLALGKETKTKLEHLSGPQVVRNKRKLAQTHTNCSVLFAFLVKSSVILQSPPPAVSGRKSPNQNKNLRP